MPPHVDVIGPRPVYPPNNTSKGIKDMTYVKGDDAPRRGHARMKQLADETRSEIAAIAAAMIGGLGRPATELETLQAEAISALFLKARRLRDRGMDDIEHLREAAFMTKGSAFAQPMVAATSGGTVRMIPPANAQ
jgi:hypothetical protein